MNFFKEAILEPPARWWRYRVVLPFLVKKKFRLLDLGCGPEAYLGKLMKGRVSEYIGIDPLVRKQRSGESNWKLLRKTVVKKIPLASESIDILVCTAFIEHIDYPKEVVTEAVRVLKKGGRLIVTTPTPRAKRLLEFLAFRLGWLSKREITEHKQYFDKESLVDLVKGCKVRRVCHYYFELGLNNLLVVTK